MLRRLWTSRRLVPVTQEMSSVYNSPSSATGGPADCRPEGTPLDVGKLAMVHRIGPAVQNLEGQSSFFQKEGYPPLPPYGEVGVEAWEKGKRGNEWAAAPHAGPPLAEASSPHTLRTKV